ncbi:MAG: T9SS C-terminal target domain-containing protein [Bacteroidetes bacterium]|nr:MAG: T9SS C-terminal target domain-containing protein [Bacteroidota bacterium]
MLTKQDYYNLNSNNLRLLKIDNRDVSLFTLQTITGIKGESVKSKITIYPNPTTSKVKLNSGFDGDSHIELVDFTGKVLQTFKSNSSETEIDLSAYSDGMYFFKINNRIGKQIVKVVKIEY